MILALKTDSDPTEFYIIDKQGKISKQKKWHSERSLAKNLLAELDKILNGNFNKLSGLIVFSGPGSFTGLRIGITVMNTIAYAQNIPIIGTSGENWIKEGIKRLNSKDNDKIVIPNYGADVNITKPKK